MSAKRFLIACFVALLASNVAEAGIDDWLKRKAKDIVGKAASAGVDGISNYIADGLAADGEHDAAEAVRNSGDAVEAAIEASMDATACFGTVSAGATIGSLAGPLGTAFGAAVGAAFNPSCWEAVSGFATTVKEAIDTGRNVADVINSEQTCDPQCSGNAVPMCSTQECSEYCDSLSPSCFTWYMDEGCCLCKSHCDHEPSNDDWVETPTYDQGTSSGNCAPIIEYGVDYWGADIVPVTTKWADTAVSAASPEDCCEACSLYSFCQAWTFTAGKHCKERFPKAPGCCFLKKGSGWEVRYEPDMVSGTVDSQRAVASCTVEYDTILKGGGLSEPDGSELVVPTISDVDCCNACANTPNCNAWTMTPPSECSSRFNQPIVGCCFLKGASGWSRTNDDKGVMTSGQVVSWSKK